MALSLERSLSGTETRDNSSIAQRDDDCTDENSDLDGDILKELESCLESITAGNTANE